LSDLPASVRLLVVVPADVGAEVAEPGLAGRAAAVGAHVGNGVVEVDGSADGGVGEDIGGVAQLQLFAEAGGDFVGIDSDLEASGRPPWQMPGLAGTLTAVDHSNAGLLRNEQCVA
jgi:hypothetical protein